MAQEASRSISRVTGGAVGALDSAFQPRHKAGMVDWHQVSRVHPTSQPLWGEPDLTHGSCWGAPKLIQTQCRPLPPYGHSSTTVPCCLLPST